MATLRRPSNKPSIEYYDTDPPKFSPSNSTESSPSKKSKSSASYSSSVTSLPSPTQESVFTDGEIPLFFRMEEGASWPEQSVTPKPVHEIIRTEYRRDVDEVKGIPKLALDKVQEILDTYEPLMKELRELVKSQEIAVESELRPALPPRPMQTAIDVSEKNLRLLKKVQTAIDVYEKNLRLLSPTINRDLPKAQWDSHVKSVVDAYTSTYNISLCEGPGFAIILKNIEEMRKREVLSSKSLLLDDLIL
jgi:hypothetical protein